MQLENLWQISSELVDLVYVESAFKVVYSQQRVEDSVVVEDWI